ncbi:MAG: site-specific integrase [Thermoanaerobaculia bacterium]|nr:site-specific integrase [Thermoanaerobaculia bacterium]
MRDARARRDLVAAEIAAGRDPRTLLDQLAAADRGGRTLRDLAERWAAGRVDLADETRKNIRSHLRRILPTLGHMAPADITAADVQTLVATLVADLKPASVRRYVTTLRQILDAAGADPNPARTVRLPRIVTEEPQPPTGRQLLAILDHVPARYRLPLILLEQTGIRVGEACSLTWGDVDLAEQRLRLRAARTKTRRARWVQMPGWVADAVADTCPPDDRAAERPVFPGLTGDVAKNAMARACRAAGIPVFSPHDLRHRRGSLWHGQGVPAKELAARLGHARASMSLDVYAHVMPIDEVSVEALRAALVRSR